MLMSEIPNKGGYIQHVLMIGHYDDGLIRWNFFNADGLMATQ
jgi:hypothetical protein